MKRKGLIFLPAVFVLTFSSCDMVDDFYHGSKTMYALHTANVTTFNVGDAFTLEGLKLVDSTTIQGITGYNSSIEEGYVFKVADVGTKEVTISYPRYKDYKYEIEVTNLKQLSLSGNYPTEFIVEDYFSYDGLVVTCDGETITDFEVSISTSNRLREEGTFTVFEIKGYFCKFFSRDTTSLYSRAYNPGCFFATSA